MRGWSVTLALCVVICSAMLGARAAYEDGAALWQNLIAEYLRNAPGASGASHLGLVPGTTPAGAGVAGAAVSWAKWFTPPAPTLMHAEGGLSVLVVPVPVPVPFAAPTNTAQCPLSPQPARSISYDSYSAPAPAPDTQAFYGRVLANNPPHQYLPVHLAAPASPASTSEAPPPPLSPRPLITTPPPPPPTPPPPPRSSSRRPSTDERLASDTPRFPPVDDSRLLLEKFRAQEPKYPTRPPIVRRQADSQVPAGRTRLICKKRTWKGREGEAPPPPPLFEGSLYLRGRMFVQRAGYTEPFSLWWDAFSAASRMDFHDGSTSTYRMTRRDGRIQSVQIRVDRTGERDVRRCMVTPVRMITRAERLLPALPDLQSFAFAGYVERGAERTERWWHTLSGKRGELGGAREEALTFRHELLVRRAPDNFTTTPVRYTVTVDSSVLGPNCDTYGIYFDEIERKHYDSNMFNLNIEDACEVIENTNRIDIVEPLREFTMLFRDPRYDIEIDQFKKKYQRIYLDDIEEAVRKNVLMQNVRYTGSANRQGASFELEINFLYDRLVVERNVLLGVELPSDADPGETFPHSMEELEARKGLLPLNFDWRKRGFKTPVRNQNPCQSCWAIATTGAVEGALFVETRRNQPLSEQALIDCSKQWGAHGCDPTWPSFAYNYIKDKGLPARDEYTPYKAEEQTCRAEDVPSVTRISGHVNVTIKTPTALKVAIMTYGPIVVLMDVQGNNFQFIKKGYYDEEGCEKKTPNHAMLAVGWRDRRNEGSYFILKNSWSAGWGNGGYVYVRASTNTCGVLNYSSYPRLSLRDVQRMPSAKSPLPLDN